MTIGTADEEPTLESKMAKASEEEHALEASSPSTKPKQTSKDLEAALTLLKKPDDTSRFVGLALLKPLLEQELSSGNTVNEKERHALTQQCWDAIPVKFMERLLKARVNDRRTKEEANDMEGLAVAIIHAFAALLASPHADEKFMSQVRQSCEYTLGSMPFAVAVRTAYEYWLVLQS